MSGIVRIKCDMGLKHYQNYLLEEVKGAICKYLLFPQSSAQYMIQEVQRANSREDILVCCYF